MHLLLQVSVSFNKKNGAKPTFRSSLKTSAAVVKWGIELLQWGHPGERTNRLDLPDYKNEGKISPHSWRIQPTFGVKIILVNRILRRDAYLHSLTLHESLFTIIRKTVLLSFVLYIFPTCELILTTGVEWIEPHLLARVGILKSTFEM